MARINVEDDYWSDPRREILARLVGDQERADGRMLRAWRVAQGFWKKDELIPPRMWDTGGFDGILEADLAEKRDGGIYVRGAEGHFGWLESRARAGQKGGKRSGETRKKKAAAKEPNEANPKQIEANASSLGSKPEANTKPLPLPLPLLSSPPASNEAGVPPPSFDESLAARWAEWARSRSTTVKPVLAKWADELRKVRELDRISEADLEMAFAHAQADERFWATNAVSVMGLRERGKNGLLKIENLVNAARSSKRTTNGSAPVKSGHKQPIVESREELRRERHGN